MKILIIGGGNMGLTYARSFLRSHITSKEDMMILEKFEVQNGKLALNNKAAHPSKQQAVTKLVKTSTDWPTHPFNGTFI